MPLSPTELAVTFRTATGGVTVEGVTHLICDEWKDPRLPKASKAI